MRVTPLDIIQKQFNVGRRGYDPDEVLRFLDEVRESMEELLKENQRVRALIEQRDDEIEMLRGKEGDIKDTLLMARRMAEDLERGARREADIVVGEARLEAEKVLLTLHEERRELQSEVVQLRTSKLRWMSDLRTQTEAQLRFLETLDGMEAPANK